MKQREMLTDMDWSKHELTIRQEGSFTIHHLSIPNSITNNVKFINGEGVLTVTGDFGNWVFCRPFVPSEEGGVSVPYWLEKMRNYSTQEPCIYDANHTTSELNDKIEELKEENSEQNSEYIEYIERLLDYVYFEHEYISEMIKAPNFVDSEDYIIGKVLHPQLQYVFDAFNECCNRIEAQQNETEQRTS